MIKLLLIFIYVVCSFAFISVIDFKTIQAGMKPTFKFSRTMFDKFNLDRVKW